MPIEVILVFTFVGWFIGFVFTPIFDEFDRPTQEYAWWPLILFKEALKGLSSVLFTGWKVKP